MTIKEKVKKAEDKLKSFESHQELTKWAKDNEMDNRAAFSNFKKALLEIDVDYNAMRYKFLAEERKKKQEELAKQEAKNKTITLFSDAKASANRFAICDQHGDVVWAGNFDTDGQLEQSVCEMDAAKKAVWLAKKVCEVQGLDSINLILKVDAQWLTYANAVKRGAREGGKSRVLGYLAAKNNINLTVEHIAGVENPADPFTTSTGFESWSENLENIKLT